MSQPETPDSGWHLDKRVSLGHIVTTLAVATGVILAYADLRATDQKLAQQLLAEAQARQQVDKHLEARMTRTENRLADTLREIRDAIVRIENKLDGKADRTWAPPQDDTR